MLTIELKGKHIFTSNEVCEMWKVGIKWVITNITDKWQDECRRMRDECSGMKTTEDDWETSADE